jgi:hypothetical protein
VRETGGKSRTLWGCALLFVVFLNCTVRVHALARGPAFCCASWGYSIGYWRAQAVRTKEAARGAGWAARCVEQTVELAVATHTALSTETHTHRGSSAAARIVAVSSTLVYTPTVPCPLSDTGPTTLSTPRTLVSHSILIIAAVIRPYRQRLTRDTAVRRLYSIS